MENKIKYETGKPKVDSYSGGFLSGEVDEN